MTSEDYDMLVSHTRIYPDEHKITYPLMALAGEVGEVCNKYAKVLRGDKSIAHHDVRHAIAMELGDCLWFIYATLQDLGVSPEQVMEANSLKLMRRSAEGKLKGDGDER